MRDCDFKTSTLSPEKTAASLLNLNELCDCSARSSALQIIKVKTVVHVSLFVLPQLYLYEAVARLMAGANPTETHHLLQRSTLRQRIVTSCDDKGHQHEDAGTIAHDQHLFCLF